MARSANRTVNLARMLGLAVGVCVAGSVVVACSSSGGGGTASDGANSSAGTAAPSEAVSNSSAANFVSGGTFTFGMNADPGNLDPQASAASNLYQMSFLAYDPLLSISTAGKIQSQLATSWKEQGKTITLTLHKGITCSDGSPFTAKTAADNVNYVADPKNKSPFNGVFIAAGAKATANASSNTVTITLPAPAPFALNGLAGVPMVCANGMANRKLLATKTDGTGPFTLTQAAANDQYTLAKRSGYTWGPNGATTAAKGMPDKIVVKIVPNETTATNLLLSGQLNATTVVGPDTQRLEAANLFSVGTPSVIGEMWYNQAPGRLTADPKVRAALTQAVDLGELQKVLTSGRGEPATTFAAIPPVACPGNSIAKALPAHDLAKAKSLLDSDGWKVGGGGIRTKAGKQLALSLLYNTQSGAAGSAAAELAAQQWHQLGVKVTLKAQDETAATNTLFSSGDWDIVWEPLNVSSPDQLVGFMSGAAPPTGENFAHIKNSAYEQAVTKAQQTQGTAGCAQWLSAESSLVSGSDVIPFANQVQKTFGKGAQFQVLGELQPTSIRMTG